MLSIIVGLTGQTGAGKSTVSHMAEEWGCAVIEADAVAREALAPGSRVLQSLADAFGQDIIRQDGSCDRKLLAARAFSGKENTALLNRITHPWIIQRIREYIDIYRRKNQRLILLDAPQLFESGADTLCRKIIAVTAPENVRKQRIMSRDHLSEQEADLRMQAQYPEKFFRSHADFLIDGSDRPENVRKSLYHILDELC